MFKNSLSNHSLLRVSNWKEYHLYLSSKCQDSAASSRSTIAYSPRKFLMSLTSLKMVMMMMIDDNIFFREVAILLLKEFWMQFENLFHEKNISFFFLQHPDNASFAENWQVGSVPNALVITEKVWIALLFAKLVLPEYTIIWNDESTNRISWKCLKNTSHKGKCNWDVNSRKKFFFFANFWELLCSIMFKVEFWMTKVCEMFPTDNWQRQFIREMNTYEFTLAT